MRNIENYRVACYERLSREDGDKLESDSILTQQHILEDYLRGHPEFDIVDHYIDDGYTGTNFNRPSFKRMIKDIEDGKVNCVIVKDLSRFGRDYIDCGFYLERWFPEHSVRFIAINDREDSLNGPYSMLLPMKNIYNAQYARDISEKVRSAMRSKQRRGDFVGAFASYGYLKDPKNHNHLIPDPVASQVVKRVFELAASGMGQIRIAKLLNGEGIPCPSEYKRMMGENYTNCHRLDSTKYWTYATIHRMLTNEYYIGSVVSNRSIRSTMHGRPKAAKREDWIVVADKHEAIISKELWNAVQAQVAVHSRGIDFEHNRGLFSGFLHCGDCGRSVCKKRSNGRVSYSCGSYQRYGPRVCTPHYIAESTLEAIVLEDLNRIIRSVTELKEIAERNQPSNPASTNKEAEVKRLEASIARLRRLKQRCYEDYCEDLLSKDDFMQYKAEY